MQDSSISNASPPASLRQPLTIEACSKVDDFEAWDRFLENFSGGHYFQTYGWLRSYEPMSFTPEVLVARSEAGIVGGVGYLTARVPALPWRIAIIPHGPTAPAGDVETWTQLMQALDARLRRTRTVYAQIYPHERSEEHSVTARLAALGFTEPPLFNSHRFSSTPVHVALAGRSEDDILRSLRKNTRYYVRRSQESGLELRTEVDAPLFERIHRLLVENGELLGYQTRPYASLRSAWDWFAPRGRAAFLQAWHGDVLVGAILQIYTGRTAYYLAGAVRRGYQEQGPAEFLHWAAIREALRRELETYDMVNLSSPGVEQFKRGFRPEIWAWHEPRTKIYSPTPAKMLHTAEVWLRPLLRRFGRWMARGGRTESPPQDISDGR